MTLKQFLAARPGDPVVWKKRGQPMLSGKIESLTNRSVDIQWEDGTKGVHFIDDEGITHVKFPSQKTKR